MRSGGQEAGRMEGRPAKSGKQRKHCSREILRICGNLGKFQIFSIEKIAHFSIRENCHFPIWEISYSLI